MTGMKHYIYDGYSYNVCGAQVCKWKTIRQYDSVTGGYGDRSRLRALLLFFDDELKYDIANCAKIQGDAEISKLEAGKGERMLSHYIDVCQDQNMDWVNRILDLAISECEDATYIISRFDIDDNEVLDDEMPDKVEYAIELRIEDGFNDGTIRYLEKLIHDYMVARVLYEWAELTYPDFAKYWAEKMEADLLAIKKCTGRASAGDAFIVPAW